MNERVKQNLGKELKKYSGTQFEPKLVDEFVKLIEKK